MTDEPLFSLELGDHRCPLNDGPGEDDDDDDDENRFVVHDTGADPLQTR